MCYYAYCDLYYGEKVANWSDLKVDKVYFNPTAEKEKGEGLFINQGDMLFSCQFLSIEDLDLKSQFPFKFPSLFFIF